MSRSQRNAALQVKSSVFSMSRMAFLERIRLFYFLINDNNNNNIMVINNIIIIYMIVRNSHSKFVLFHVIASSCLRVSKTGASQWRR